MCDAWKSNTVPERCIITPASSAAAAATETASCFVRESSSLEVDRISASVSVSATNVDMGTFGGHSKAIVPHSVHFRFRRAAVGKFGGCRK